VAKHVTANSTLVFPWLGFQIEAGSTTVECAARDSAVSGGVRAGDIVRAIGGISVRTPADVDAAIDARRVNAATDVVVSRHGRTRTMKALVSALPRVGAPHATP